MRKRITLILCCLALCISFFACKKEPPVETDSSNFYAIDLTKDTDTEADLCFIHKDGSYAVFYFDTENQNYAVHIGPSIEKAKLNDGYDIILDNNGYPQTVKSKEFTIYFANFSGNTFDAAIDYKGEIQYLWGLQADIDIEKLLTNWNNNGSKGWEYWPRNTKEWTIFGTTILKVTGVAITVVAAVSTGGLAALITAPVVLGVGSYVMGELKPSTIVEGMNLGVGLGSFNFTHSWSNGVSLACTFITSKWYQDIYLGTDKTPIELMKDPEYRPYQIQLSTYHLEISYPSSAIILVETLSSWKIIEEDQGWCVAKKIDNNTIKVEIKEQKSDKILFRVCSDPYNANIPCAYFVVEQVLPEYTISKESLNFNSAGGQDGFTVSVAYPLTVESVDVGIEDDKTWCHVTTQGGGGYSVTSVTVKVDPNEKGARDSFIQVTFKLGESRFFKDIQIRQEGKESPSIIGMWTFHSTGLNFTKITHISILDNGYCRYYEGIGNPTYSSPWSVNGNTITIDNEADMLIGTINSAKNKISGNIHWWHPLQNQYVLGDPFEMNKTQ